MLVTSAIAQSVPGARFASAALRTFAALDADESGLVTRDEVLLALTNPVLEGEGAAVVATLYRQDGRGRLASLSNDQWGPERGITAADLQALPGSGLSKKFDKRFSECLEAVESFSSQLFVREPSAEAVRQGGVSNCWWLAPLTGKVAADPASFKKSFEVLEDGQYRVSLPDGKEVTIAPPTAAEGAAFASSGSSGHWLTALEKARGEANQSILSESVVQRNLESSSLSRGIRQTTGAAADEDWLLWTSADTTRAKMIEHLGNGDVVVAATGPGLIPRLTGNGERLEGLVSLHAYSVLAYDQNSDKLTLRNPYGDTEWDLAADGVDDGEFEMSMTDFHQLFSLAAYQQPVGA